jgi:hypothetical protein
MFMIRFLKELYLTWFTVGFRFRSGRGWGPIMDAGKGVFFVAILMFLILAGIEWRIEIFVGKKLLFDSGRWVFIAVGLAVYYVNYYVLITRGHGIRFEREFDNLKKSRKVLLQVSCAVLLLAIITFFSCSVSAYHRFFHVIPKN